MPSGGDMVVLPGAAMTELVRAVAALDRAGLTKYAVVGGLAVTARLRQAHRSTSDIDAVVDETSPPDALTALLELPEAQAGRPGRQEVLLHGTSVELLPVTPLQPPDLYGLETKDALFAAAHWWALQTATSLTLVAGEQHEVEATAPFATAPALIAMKLHAIQDRGGTAMAKRAGDAWDIYRLLVDLDADGSVSASLAGAFPELRLLVRDATERILISHAEQTCA